jgi:CRP/FNR family cyclic AMP-dependent transcriptional regulator
VSTASELIRKIDFFQPLDDRIVEKIARVCITREYSPGDHIVRQGDPGLGLYFITRGSARVEITRDGAVTQLADLNAGEFVGELSIIDKKPRSANVVCTTDVSCLLLTRDSFLKLLDKYPEIALQMAKALAARLRSTDERMWQNVKVAPLEPVSDVPAVVVEHQTHAETRERSDKQKIKDLLADTFGWFYLAKAMMQVSLAVVGCPVTVNLETRASQSLLGAIGPLKLVMFPAGESHVIGVHPFADGDFTATILQPVITSGFTGISVSRFKAPVRRNESVRLCIPSQASAARFARPLSPHFKMRDLAAAFDL